MIQADHLLAVTRRGELLDVARSTVYYRCLCRSLLIRRAVTLGR